MMKVLMLQDKPVTEDNRVFREAKSLVSAGYSVTLVEPQFFGYAEKENIEGILVKRILPVGIFQLRNHSLRKRVAAGLSSLSFDVMHCHDHQMLQLGTLIRLHHPQTTLIYDSHELFHSYPLHIPARASKWLQMKSRMARWMEVRREKKNAMAANHIITVNNSLADILQQHFRRSEKPVVLRNICESKKKAPRSEFHFRKKFGWQEEKKILVFLGMYVHRDNMNLKQVMSEFANEPDVGLLFICKLNEEVTCLENWLKQNEIHNVRFHDFIPYEKICDALFECTVGLDPVWNRNDRSYWLALHNKMFEYIHAQLPVLATMQPELMRFVRECDIGVCVNPDQKNAYVNGFRKIISEYDRFRENARAAAEKYNWESEQQQLLNLYAKIEHQLNNRS